MPSRDDFTGTPEERLVFDALVDGFKAADPLAVEQLAESAKGWTANRERLDRAGYDQQPSLSAGFDRRSEYLSVEITELGCGLLVGMLPPTLTDFDGESITLNEMTVVFNRERACRWMCLAWLHLTGEYVSMNQITGQA